MKELAVYNNIEFMKRCLIFVIFMMFCIAPAFAYELILPKEKKTFTNNKYAFFVGRAGNNESIMINDEKIYTASNGAFAYSVELNEGENRIAVKSNYGMKIYKIYKNSPQEKVEPPLEESSPVLYVVLKDNTPLRSTPVDYGMNRMSHLFEGTKLIVNGKKGNFYRVFLSKDKIGWIDKDAVQKFDGENIISEFLTVNSKTYKNASEHTIEFTEKLPYTIDETKGEIFFKVYNPFVSEDSVYTITARKPDKYVYKTVSSNGVYVFKVSALPCVEKVLEGINIFVDAGHGGTELGAIGCLGDKEKDINLKIANELKEALLLMGANVYMSRECDGFVSLDDRVNMAKNNCVDIFVSIHLNSIPDIKMDIHKNRGTSVYYYNPNSKDLASAVLRSVTKGVKTRNDGLRTASFAVIRPTEYLGILVETAYMTNPLDSVMYTNEEFPRETAKAIAEGILNYVQSK